MSKFKEYVLDGAVLKCSMGDKSGKLKVLSNNKYTVQGKKVATLMDYTNANMLPPIGTFGTCQPYKSTPVPLCTYIPTGPWLESHKSQKILGMPALLGRCKLICPRAGGVITIEDTGQL